MQTVEILIGLPGSGKSTYAKKLFTNLGNLCICSADHFFETPDGGYNFNPAKIGEAHGACLRKFVKLLSEHHSLVVVDNTNLSVSEIAPYYALAEAYGYEVKIHVFEVSVETSFARNTHKVPIESIQRMASSLHDLRFGWPKRWVKPTLHKEEG